MPDTLPFAVQLTADRKYLNVRIPVASLPAELIKRPSSMNVRLESERLTGESAGAKPWRPPYLLALVSR